MTMQPIEQQVHDAFEIVSLENLFEEEMNCEGRKAAHGDLQCTVEVTHLAASCSMQDIPVCDALVTYKRSQMDQGAACLCGTPAVDCWSYRPI